MSIAITKENFNDIIVNGDKPVLVDFWAAWCGPCKMVGPIIEELSGELEGKVVVGKIDVDAQPELSAQFGVMNIPTIILFKDGKEAQRSVGFKSKDQLKAFFEI